MGNNLYQPTNNYERNFLLVKRFGGKLIVLIVPILLLFKILCIGYLSVTKNEMMEITITRLLTSKINPELNFHGFESTLMIISCFASLYFIFAFMSFFLSCRDPSYDSVPKFGLSIMNGWSVIQLVMFSLGFAATAFFLILFIFKDPKYFEALGNLVNMEVNQIRSYKLSIAIAAVIICAVMAVMIWFSQSQLEFIKSLRLTLVNSVARNKGVHTYGVFSMSIAIAFLFIAGGMTFMYYCYKDALNGFGISMDDTYVLVSLTLAYIRGLVPFFVAVCAFTFSEMVDEANSLGTIYYDNAEIFGTVKDPNMGRKRIKPTDNPNIKC